MALGSKLASYLFTSALANAILPIFSIFLPLFAAELGASPLELGLVGGAAYAVYSFMPFVMGHFSDRSGSRKFFILSSLALLVVVSFLYSASADPVAVVIVRIFEGIGWATLWPAIEAAVTEDTPRDSKSSLAIFNYSWSAGAAAGPGLGTLLVTTLSYRETFLVCSALFVVPLAANTLAFLVEGGRRPAVEPDVEKPSGARPGLRSSIREIFFTADRERNFRVWTSFITAGLSALTGAVFYTFFGPYAASIGVSVVTIGAATSTLGAVRFVVYLALANRALRNWLLATGRRNRNALAFTSLATLSGLFLLVRDPTAATYFLAFGLLGLGSSLAYAISQATIIGDTPTRVRGAGAGLFESSLGIGGTLGPIVAGAVSSGSLTTAFTVPVAGLGLSLLLLYSLSRVGGGGPEGS